MEAAEGSRQAEAEAQSKSESIPAAGEAPGAAAGSAPAAAPQQAAPAPTARAAAAGGSSADADAAQFDFFTRLYKVEPCLLRVPHDWAQCPFAHRQGGERSARRDLRVYPYQSIPCVYAKQRQPCPNGDLCPNAHSLTEYWLHPARFRTERCQFGSACKRPVCFFAHTAEQLRPLDPALPPAELCWQTGSSLTFGRGKRAGGRAAAAGPAAPAVPLQLPVAPQGGLLGPVAGATAPAAGGAAASGSARAELFNLTSLVAALPASSDDLLAGTTLLPLAAQKQSPPKLQQDQPLQLQQLQQAPVAGPLPLALPGVPPIGLTDPALSALLIAAQQQQQQQAASLAAAAAARSAGLGWGLLGPVTPASGGLGPGDAAPWRVLQQQHVSPLHQQQQHVSPLHQQQQQQQQQQQGACAGLLAAGGRQPSGPAPLASGGAAPAVASPQQLVYMML